MHFILLGFLTAVSYTIVCVKTLGWGRLVYLQVPLDIVFTILVPLGLSFGTMTGAMVGVMAGLSFSLILMVASLFVKPKPLRRPKA